MFSVLKMKPFAYIFQACTALAATQSNRGHTEASCVDDAGVITDSDSIASLSDCTAVAKLSGSSASQRGARLGSDP